MRTRYLTALVIGLALPSLTLAWTAPTSTPPGGNVPSPINTGSVAQLKNGTLGVNGLGVFGNTILNGTNGDGIGNGVNSYLNFGATAGQAGYGIRDNNGTLEFKNLSGSWGSFNVTLTNLMQVNGITANGLGQITSIKFGDGTTQTTANPWSTNGTNIYYNGGNVGIGTSNPIGPLMIQTSGETTDTGNDINFFDYSGSNIFTPVIAFNHARGTSVAPAALKAGDLVGAVISHPHTGSGFGIGGAGMSFVADTDASASSYPTGILFSTTPANSNSIMDRVRITGAGNVGIGTLNPAQQLDLTGNQYIEGGAIYFLDGYSPGNPLMYIQHYNNNLLVCNATLGTFTYTSCSFAVAANGSGVFYGPLTATAYYSSSDQRLKTNIHTFPDALQLVEQLRGVTFDWKKDGTPSAGVIAQEVEKVLPSAVTTNPQTGMKTVDYDQFVAPMIEAIKEQQTQLDAQKKETDTQKLCISKSDGTNVCVTGDQLAALLANQATHKTQ